MLRTLPADLPFVFRRIRSVADTAGYRVRGPRGPFGRPETAPSVLFRNPAKVRSEMREPVFGIGYPSKPLEAATREKARSFKTRVLAHREGVS